MMPRADSAVALDSFCAAVATALTAAASDSAAAYSNAELREKDLRFGGVSVFYNGVTVRLLDESIGNQAVQSQAFICIQICRPFHAPPGDDITKNRKFFVGDCDGFSHLTAPYELPTVQCVVL